MSNKFDIPSFKALKHQTKSKEQKAIIQSTNILLFTHPHKIYLSIIVIFLFSMISIIFIIKSKDNGDNTLSYKNMITVNKKIIEYCEERNLYNDKIYSNFLMKYNLQNTFLGYLNSDNTFTIVDDFNDADYIIISSNENYPNKDMIKDPYKLNCLKV